MRRRGARSFLIVLAVLLLAAVVRQQASSPQAPPAGQPAGPPAGPPAGQPGGPPPFGPPGGQQARPPSIIRRVFRWSSSSCPTASRSRCGRRRRCSTIRPTSTSIATAASGWPKACATARITPASPKATASWCCEDTNGDGKADKSTRSCRRPTWSRRSASRSSTTRSSSSQPPDLIVYTDVDRNLKFDPAVDKREVLLTGFQGVNHDHSLHSVTVGPDGKWYFNSGNTGAMFTDKSGKTFRIFGAYRAGPVGPFKNPHDPAEYAGKPSDDGHVYVGGFTVRMNPDGTNAEIIGHNYRNSYEQSVTSLGDVFQNDNDDPPACRVSWVMEYANFGFSSNDGQRSWQADRRPGQTMPVAEWRQDDPGMTPAGDVYGGGSPTGIVFYENGALGAGLGRHVLRRRSRTQRDLLLPAEARRAPASSSTRKIFLTSNVKQQYAGLRLRRRQRQRTGAIETLFRPSDIAVGPDGALYVSDWIDPRVGGHQDLDDTLVRRDLPDRAEGLRVEGAGVRRRDDRRPDHGAAVARGQRARDRLRRAEGARRGGGQRGRGAAQGSQPVHARPGDLSCSTSSGPRAASARARRSRRPIRRCASPPTAPCGAPASTCCRSRRVSPRRATPASGAKSRSRCATSPPPRRSTSSSTSRAATTARIAAISRRWAPARPARRRRSTIGCERELGVKADPLTWSPAFARIAWRLHVPAAVPDLTARAQSAKLPLADRRLALDTLAFIKDPAASKAMLTLARAGQPAARAGDVVAAEPHVERLGGLRAAARR